MVKRSPAAGLSPAALPGNPYDGAHLAHASGDASMPCSRLQKISRRTSA
jgi:hypothetical protein